MVLRLKITLAFAAMALMAVIVSFVLQQIIPGAGAAALLAMVVSVGLAAAYGYVWGGGISKALSDLNTVILRFTKWDMDGVVPHAAREEFLSRVRDTHRVLRRQPGFIRDALLEQVAGPGRFNSPCSRRCAARFSKCRSYTGESSAHP